MKKLEEIIKMRCAQCVEIDNNPVAVNFPGQNHDAALITLAVDHDMARPVCGEQLGVAKIGQVKFQDHLVNGAE